MKDYSYILPEIYLSRRVQSYYAGKGKFVTIFADVGPPTFPDACPSCGSAKTDSDEWKASYACGAAYTEKPQIQNHTDVWWGTCPVTRALVALKGDM